MTVSAGYDPGYAKCAVAIVERTPDNRLKLLHRQLVITKPEQPDWAREGVIWRALSAPVREFHPVVLGIEDQTGVSTAARVGARRRSEAIAKGNKPPKGIGFNASNDNVIGAVWLAKGCALAYGVQRVMVTPQQAKIAVLGKGGGKGDKNQMIAAVKMLFPELNDVKLSDHEADAIAIAVLAGRIIMTGVAA